MEQKLRQFLLWTNQILIQTNQKSNTSIRQEHLEQETRLVIGCFGKTISSPYLDRLRGKKDNRDS